MPITSIIEQQIPEFIRHDTDGHHFLTFLEYYYKFLSKSWDVEIGDLRDVSIELLQNETENSLRSERGEVYQQLISLKEMRDIDTAPVSLVSNFVSEYMDGVNAPALDSIRSNMKLMKNFYASKGNENSFHFLFNLLYDEVITISYPYEKTLKLSESNWIDRDFVRVDSDTVTVAQLDKAIDTSIGNGILRSYFYDVVVSSDRSKQKGYYKLSLSDVIESIVEIPISLSQGDDPDISLSPLYGLHNIDIWIDDYEPSNIYPSDTIDIVNESSANSSTQFGAIVEIEYLKKYTFNDEDSSVPANKLITCSINGSQSDGVVELVHDYFTVYEYDLEAGNSIGDLTLKGIKSEATANVIAKESNKLWIEDIEGTFISDFQANENGGSESIVLLNSGVEVGSLRFGRKYTACVFPATIVIKGGSIVIVHPGRDYIFTPYVKNSKIIITGLGKFDRDKNTGKTIGIKITDMGVGYGNSILDHPDSHQSYNEDYKIVLNNSDSTIGYGSAGKNGTEKYVESTLNTLDGGAKLRDSNYYQEFSYEILSSVPMDVWSAPIKKIVHPSGMKVFGKEIIVSSPFDLSPTVDQFPSWSEFYLNPEGAVINLTSGAQFTFSMEVDGAVIFDDVVGTSVANSTVNTYSMTSNNFDILDSIVSYGDIISRLSFIDFVSQLNTSEYATGIHSVKNIEYHFEDISLEPEASSDSLSLSVSNPSMHSMDYGTVLKGKTDSTKVKSSRNISTHNFLWDGSLSGSGNTGVSDLVPGGTLFEKDYDQDSIDGYGIGEGKGSLGVTLMEKVYDSGLSGESTGEGKSSLNSSKFPQDFDTGVPSTDGNGVARAVRGPRVHKYVPYYTSLSGSGDS